MFQRHVDPHWCAGVGAVAPDYEIGIVEGGNIGIPVCYPEIATYDLFAVLKNPGKRSRLRVGAVAFGSAFVGGAGSIAFKRINIIELAALQGAGGIRVYRTVLV